METLKFIIYSIQFLLILFNLGAHLITKDKHTEIITLLWVCVLSVPFYTTTFE